MPGVVAVQMGYYGMEIMDRMLAINQTAQTGSQG